MKQTALGRAMVAAGGTMLVLGGSTMVLSTVGMTATRLIADRRKKQYLVPCTVCTGKEKVKCNICKGARTLKYHPTKQMPVDPHTECVCAMCEGSGLQTCLNCLGEGASLPLSQPEQQ